MRQQCEALAKFSIMPNRLRFYRMQTITGICHAALWMWLNRLMQPSCAKTGMQCALHIGNRMITNMQNMRRLDVEHGGGALK